MQMEWWWSHITYFIYIWFKYTFQKLTRCLLDLAVIVYVAVRTCFDYNYIYRLHSTKNVTTCNNTRVQFKYEKCILKCVLKIAVSALPGAIMSSLPIDAVPWRSRIVAWRIAVVVSNGCLSSGLHPVQQRLQQLFVQSIGLGQFPDASWRFVLVARVRNWRSGRCTGGNDWFGR